MNIFGRKNKEDQGCIEENRQRELRRKIKIGAFFAVALVILIFFMFVVGDLGTLFQKRGYPIFVYFDSVAGLERRTSVRMAGVKVGYLQDIRLKDSQAEVLLSIKDDVKIRKGSKATQAALGLLGEKYIEILVGKEEGFYKPGDAMEGSPSVTFDQMGTMLLSVGNEVKEVGEAIKAMLGEEGSKTNFKETLENLSIFSSDLRDFLSTNKQDLTQSFQQSSQTIQKFDQRIDEVSKNLEELISLLKDTVEENRKDIRTSLENIKEVISSIEKSLGLLNESLEKINKGEGSLGKLIQQPELYQRAEEAVGDFERVIRPLSSLRVTVGLRADYYSERDLVKNTFSFGLWPTPQKYMLAQVIYDPFLEKFTYSAQGGVRWGPLSPRAGIIESKVGAGIDYYSLGDRLKVSFDSYDFNRRPRPRFRLLTRYTAFKFLYFHFGVDDFTLAPNREVFFGLGLGL